MKILSKLKRSSIIHALRDFKANSIFIRMLIATFSVLVLLCAINFVGIRIMTQKSLLNEKNNSEFYLDYSFSYINKLLQKLDEYINVLNYDQNVVFVRSLPGNIEYARNKFEINNISKQISILSGLIDEINMAYIYFPNINRIITTGGTYEPPTFFNKNYSGDYKNWLRLLMQKHTYLLSIWDLDTSAGNFSQLNLIDSIYENRKLKSVIVANLSADLVNDIFKGNEYASTRRIYITGEDLTIYSSNTDEHFGTKLDIERTKVAKSEQGSYLTRDFMISYRYQPERHIYFIVMTPKAVILKNVNNLTRAAYLFLAIMLFATLILAIILSQQFYLPIKQILIDIERVSILSRGLPRQQNEYEFINNNINAIVSKNKQLETVYYNSMPLIIDIIIMKLAAGGLDKEDGILLAQLYNIEFKSKFYCVTLMKSAHSYVNMPQKELIGLIAQIKNQLAENVVSVLKLKEDEIIIVTFYNDQDNDANKVLMSMQQLSTLLQDTYEENFYLIVGCLVNNIYELYDSINSARKAYSYRRIQENALVYNTIDVDHDQIKKNVNVPIDFEQRYMNALRTGNIKSSEDLIYNLLDSFFSKDVEFIKFYKLCMWLHYIMEHVIDSSHDVMVNKLSKNLLEDISLAGDPLELSECTLRNNRVVCSAFTTEKNFDNNFKKLILYIEQNFNKNINMESVATVFGYNSSYLSRLFKQYMGICFSDYIIRKRIDYAKELLTNSNKIIKKIAEESGYNSVGIFIKSFVKLESVTPGEYRERNKIIDI